LADIYNHVRISDLIDTSGQPTREQFGRIAAERCTTVVNLAMPDSKNAIVDEGAVVTGLGMRYFHIPVNFERPTAEHLRTFIKVMRALEGEKVWVHCAFNWRVSAFMYHYLRFEKGVAAADARGPVLKAWEPEMPPVWVEFLKLEKADLGPI